jgi:histone H2A
MLVMIDLVDFFLHRIATKADSVASQDSQRKLSDICLTPPYANVQEPDEWLMASAEIPKKLIGHQILAQRPARGGRDEFLVAFEGYEDKPPTWETREDVERVGLDLGAFEAKSATDKAAAYRNFEEVYTEDGEPFAPNVLTTIHIESAVRALLPGELAKYAVYEMCTAVCTYSTSLELSRRKGSGLQFPVDIVGGMLASFCGKCIRSAAPVALAAVIEYLVAEVLKLAGEVLEPADDFIGPQHINLAIFNNEELALLLHRSFMMCGGVIPHDPATVFQFKESDGEIEDRTDIEYVMGVPFLIDKSRKRKRTHPQKDNSDDKVLGNMAPVTRWSREELEKACVVTFSSLSPPDSNSGATGPDPPLRGFLCPISHVLMRDPVISSDDMSYERSNIKKWLEKSKKSPVNGKMLPNFELKANHMLRNAIDEWSTLQSKKRSKKVPNNQLLQEACNSGVSIFPSMKGLHDNGWRKLIARSGAFAYDTLVFDHLREVAKQFLERLLFVCAKLATQLNSRSAITTGLLLRAIVSLDCQTFHSSSIESRIKGNFFLVPLGSGFLGHALMMTWCAPCNNHEIDWCNAASAERVDADYAGVEEEEEEMEPEAEEEDEEVKQRKRNTYHEQVLADLIPAKMTEEEKRNAKEALRTIASEQITVTPVFSFSAFCSVLEFIHSENFFGIGEEDIYWEANAVMMAYQLLESHVTALIQDASYHATRAKRSYVNRVDLQLAASCGDDVRKCVLSKS